MRKNKSSSSRSNSIKYLAAVAAAAFAWAFIFLVPPEFMGIQNYLKLSPVERNYLAGLKSKYSGAQRELSPEQAKSVIKNALKFMDEAKDSPASFNTPEALALLFGTACAETLLKPRYQDFGGDAIGLFQIDYFTFKDLWERFIPNTRPALYSKIREKYSRFPNGEIYFEDLQLSDELCAVFARMKYAMNQEPLPPADNIEAQALYYKKHYNTRLGKATPQSYIDRVQGRSP